MLARAGATGIVRTWWNRSSRVLRRSEVIGKMSVPLAAQTELEKIRVTEEWHSRDVGVHRLL